MFTARAHTAPQLSLDKPPLIGGSGWIVPAIQTVGEGARLAGGRSGEDEEKLIGRLSQSAIVEALADLPHDFRDVLVLVDLGDFSYQETAQILAIPVGTVMSRLHRARRLLRQSLAASVSERKA